LAHSEVEIIRDALREHVNALAVDIGPRTPSDPGSLVPAANYIHSVFEDAGLSVREQNYQYSDQRVTNVLANSRAVNDASAYHVVGAHYDTVETTPGADDNARVPWRSCWSLRDKPILKRRSFSRLSRSRNRQLV
jgi:acetylornithine deacetylase/succinyl-diaminopimelate desuccinylase-like protein